MAVYAQVAVNVPGVSGLFDYTVPPDWTDVCQPGSLVEVPFGKQTVQGVVMSLLDYSEIPDPLPLGKLLDKQPVLNANQLNLARFLSGKYFAPVSEYLNAMLPPGLGQRADTLFSLNLREDTDQDRLSGLQQRVIAELNKRGPLRGRQLDAAFRHINWRSSVRALVRAGLVISQPVLPPPAISRKSTRMVRLTIPASKLTEVLDSIGKRNSATWTRRQAALQALASEKKPVDVSWVYAQAGATSADLNFLEKKGLVAVHYQLVWRDPLEDADVSPDQVPHLTTDQKNAWNVLQSLLEKGQFNQPVLLHGVTGSGKTELYLRIIQYVLKTNRQAVVLVPEIALTPQTIQRFLARFPGQVGVFHSRLSSGERLDTWLRARQGDFQIIIGPRSALFTPFQDPGVIIMDECHEDAFIQTEMPPYYHAREAAIAYGQLHHTLVVMGTATPDVVLYHRAQKEGWRILNLPRRVPDHRTPPTTAGDTSRALPLPEVRVIDMREELKSGNTSIISKELHSALAETLSREQQAILLLNRRGSATFVFCRDCGYTIKCPHCELPLTFHRELDSLLCHTCAYTRKMPQVCPQCRSRRIRQFGTGTEKVEDVIRKTFPQARVLRWDADTTRAKYAQDILLTQFRQHQADFLIGTQMLAKGLDLPLVTLVGVVLADVGLNFPDYRSAERVFQLLTQVAGRAGRSHLGGRVIMQTFQPDHYAIRYAAQHDFLGFYQQELTYRRQLNYPPFLRLIRFEVRDMDKQRAQHVAQVLHERLQRLVNASRDGTNILLPPTPPYFAKRAGQYRWQIILKGTRPDALLKNEDWRDVRIEVDPPSLL